MILHIVNQEVSTSIMIISLLLSFYSIFVTIKKSSKLHVFKNTMEMFFKRLVHKLKN